MFEIKDLIGDTGRSIEAGGNAPFVLSGRDKAWAVIEGHVDVFSVQIEGDRPIGARRPFFTAPSGDILLGGDMAVGRAMLAVGAFGTELREMDLAGLLALEADPAKADDIERLLRRWIRAASAAVGRDEMMPRRSSDIAGSGSARVEPGQCVHPAWKTEWIRVESGDASFLGRGDFPGIGGPSPFPLAKGTWLEAREGTSISFSEKWPTAEGGDLERALASFCGFLMECARANAELDQAAARLKMERREESRRSMAERGFRRLSTVLDSALGPLAAEKPEYDPLLSACRLVGGAAGTDVEVAASADGGIPRDLEEIARDSGFRIRHIRLEGRWWSKDNGALLAFRASDGSPLALLPSSPRRYELVDPEFGIAEPVDARVASSIDADAVAFYPLLPDSPLRGSDLLRLGLKGSRRDLATAAAAGLGGALLCLLAPWMTARLFDSIIPSAELGQLLQLAAMLAIGAISALAFDLARGVAFLRIEARAENAVQAAVWDRLLSLPLPFFAKYSAGDLAARSLGINAIRSTVSGLASSVFMAVFVAIASLILMFHYDSGLAWTAVSVCVAGLAFVACLGLVLARREGRVLELEGRHQGFLLQLITGIAKLRVTAAEEGAFALWAEGFAERKRRAFLAGKAKVVLAIFESVYPVLALMAVFIWLAWRLRGGMSTGEFLAFSSAYLLLLNAILQTFSEAMRSLDAFPIYERLAPILRATPEAKGAEGRAGTLSGGVEAHRLSFRYDPEGPYVLKDVSISVRPGEFVAIVGGSGSGKSTLLRLLLGFAPPETGAVYYDGQDLASLDARSVRRQIGVVLQESQIMPGSILEIILGSSRHTEEEAWEAARLTALDDDIREMPMGMRTVVPAGGGTLSGGQRQRLAIARAIVRKPRLLYFDEATSALDNRTQALVGRSLENLQISRVVIAHRLSTIAKADRIYVLEGGVVVELGTFEELMDSRGIFWRLARRQLV
jgi:ATP-binding cassette subfamily C protein